MSCDNDDDCKNFENNNGIIATCIQNTCQFEDEIQVDCSGCNANFELRPPMLRGTLDNLLSPTLYVMPKMTMENAVLKCFHDHCKEDTSCKGVSVQESPCFTCDFLVDDVDAKNDFVTDDEEKYADITLAECKQRARDKKKGISRFIDTGVLRDAKFLTKNQHHLIMRN